MTSFIRGLCFVIKRRRQMIGGFLSIGMTLYGQRRAKANAHKQQQEEQLRKQQIQRGIEIIRDKPALKSDRG